MWVWLGQFKARQQLVKLILILSTPYSKWFVCFFYTPSPWGIFLKIETTRNEIGPPRSLGLEQLHLSPNDYPLSLSLGLEKSFSVVT